ncbi:hypothetical protein [Catellatospora sp. TT07R-123]|uniref:hypothetical protein n=1 Tax=Catellatospora sp. TT07R-123 TaxID=2733863 RepID=UPI001BB41328|nr:hypothetical protein [Catellatospora sp. TT07R-123]
MTRKRRRTGTRQAACAGRRPSVLRQVDLGTGPDLSVNAVNCFNNAGTLTAGGFVAAATSIV